MGSGLARGAAARGRRVAFGDGRRIIWGGHCREIYRNNPNVAPPGSEGAGDLEWISYHPGRRGYVKSGGGRFVFNPDFAAPRGEFFFDATEEAEAERAAEGARGFILVDAYIPPKPQSQNKRWHGWQAVADHLRRLELDVRQFRRPDGSGMLAGVPGIETKSFRAAAAALARAGLYMGPEGGLHHAAAAVDLRAVVLFGGFISPLTTGYEGHVNFFTGGEACGSLRPCGHCRKAMRAIAPEAVVEAAEDLL
jgi:hypothetical protein